MMILRSRKVGRERGKTVEPVEMLQVSVYSLLRYSYGHVHVLFRFTGKTPVYLVSVYRFEICSM